MINFIAAAFNTLPFAGSAAITESAFNALATTAYTYAQAQLLCPIGQAVQSAYRTQGRAANRQTRLTRLALGKATPQAVATQTNFKVGIALFGNAWDIWDSGIARFTGNA